MNIKYLIKQAITDKALRIRLLNEPVQTCKEYAINLDGFAIENFDLPLFKDQAILQGGYRP